MTPPTPAPTRPQPMAAAGDDDALLRVQVVLDLTGLSESAWRALVRRGQAPPGVRLPGLRSRRWPAGEVRQWLRDRAAITP